MILTCPKCQSQYNLDPAMLGVTGRDVRCVSCGHMWFQIPDNTALDEAKKPVEEQAVPAAKSIADELNTILEKDDAAFEEVLANVAKTVSGKGEAEAPAKKPSPPVDKKELVRQEAALPVVTYNPLGLGAGAFGGAVFMLFSFVTLAVLFSFRQPLVHHYPQMSLFYRAIGMPVLAPGEGLRISELTAEKRIDNSGRALVVEGKMTNMSDRSIPYPALHLTLRDGDNKVAREMDLKPGMSEISSGDVVPLMVQVEEVPDEALHVELRVKER